MNNEIENNTINCPVCPAVLDKNGKSLTGSTKRNAMESIRPYVESVHQLMGFEYACEHFKCKADNLVDFLNRGGKPVKKVVTEQQITRNRIIALDNKVNEYSRQIDENTETIDSTVSALVQLSDIMKQWHDAQAQLNGIMSKAIEATTSNLTYRILRNEYNDVSLTSNLLSLDDIDQLKAGPTSLVEVDRPSVSKRRTGKVITSRHAKQRNVIGCTNKHRRRRRV